MLNMLVCGKSFVTQSQLNTHSRACHGERPYACEQCGKAFTTNYNLSQHLRTHSDAMPFACDFCDAKFKTQASLYFPSSPTYHIVCR
ncbi:hypothetical protein LSTR_LSTR015495 [Laodelphax striatellus]|uniref:C2H2-type domain-containing protein n=1 Tax=Laodelphax striatellus TaxID=195883 RepID=A0A482WZE0_LAOST|nr:hypothetical protein LSTR_LSTR015495 [Laodelphax striatellus]